MVIVLEKKISDSDKNELKSFLEKNHFRVNEINGEEETILGAVGKMGIDPRDVEILPGVSRVIPISKPYKMASREYKKDNTIVEIPNNRGQIIRIGGSRLVSIAGPCAVESREQMMSVAKKVAASGAVMLRGGAYKPRTSPYAFQGLAEEGLQYLKEAGDAYGLPVVTECVSADHLDAMIKYKIDCLQIGARNMQNFELLKKVGAVNLPVILKRGISATIEEWLMAAEYLLSSGAENVILCERGIRTYEKATRNTLDLSAIPILRSLTHLPIIVDPSHAVGIRDKVPPMGLAAVSAGADGIIVEVHCNPEKAFSDGAQTLYPEQFDKLMRDIDVLAPVVGKETSRIRNNITCSCCESETSNSVATKKNDSVVCAFSGSRGAYAEIAIQHYFDKQCESLSCNNFREVFQAVVDGKADYGMIPIENSLAGSVYDNYDNLIRFADISISGSIKLRIEHALIGTKETSESSIKTVYSHPQGFAQCAEFLAKHPEWNLVECSSTSEAACIVANKNSPDCAAIASELAASVSKLEVIKTGIEDDPRNYTRFIVIKANNTQGELSSNVDESATGLKLASIAFVTKNEPGALMSCLEKFNQSSMNLTRLESRPIQGQPWRYMFYVDIALKDPSSENSEISDEVLYKVIENLKQKTEDVRLLGIYSEVN